MEENWRNFNFLNFSKDKILFPYQRNAVKNAIKALWKYYQNLTDFTKDEHLNINDARKLKIIQAYEENGLDTDIDIDFQKIREDIKLILGEVYPDVEDKLSYKEFINRMSFWMATGSGKSLIIVKMIDILKILIDRGEIPDIDILFLTHKDNLINQFKVLVEEFNKYNNYSNIILKDLRELPEIKKQRHLLREGDIIVYYYRSDNLSDIQKERIIDFRNYFYNGECYVFLDEAHKGDKEESKRQYIFSLISRNGFLFNFSATFIDIRDILTCVYEYNLATFTNNGFGKHLKVLHEDIAGFREKEDFNDIEKVENILKSLILLTYTKKKYQELLKIQKNLYHKPLYLVLGKTVNTNNADLKLFFRVLHKIGKKQIKKGLFKSALDGLIKDLNEDLKYTFEPKAKFEYEVADFRNITQKDILRSVYNSNSLGDIEIIRRISNKQELAFKLKTSNKPFALLKIGDISKWIKSELYGYDIQEKFEEDTFFEELNKEYSSTNILIGAQSFYEGWDSNRPNIINFINIGLKKDSKKFILQSVGRGVRIEPIKNRRKRLNHLFNAGIIPNEELSEKNYNKLKKNIIPLETLFIYATNREVITTILQQLDDLRKKSIDLILSSFKKNPSIKDIPLLIPKPIYSDEPVLRNKNIPKYKIAIKNYEEIIRYFNYIEDDRIILMNFNTSPEKIKKVREFIVNKRNFSLNIDNYINMNIQIQNLFNFFDLTLIKDIELKELTEEIGHYKKICVKAEYFEDFEAILELAKDLNLKKKELDDLYGKISREEYEEKVRRFHDLEEFTINRKKFNLVSNKNHYYNPILKTMDKDIDFIKHIIKVESEVKFVNALEEYLAEEDNKFKEFDWWFFSKIDESIDRIFIPYYDSNKKRNFFPDFIFWLKKDNYYTILFIDPKGTEHLAWTDKVIGFKNLFEIKNVERKFTYKGYEVYFKLLLRTDDTTKLKSRINEYLNYWFDDIEVIFEKLPKIMFNKFK